MSYQTQTIDTISQIDREAWNRATRGPYFSYEWFEYVESVCSDQYAPQYIVCYHEDRLVGALPAFHVKTNDNAYENHLFGRLKRSLQRFFVFKRNPLFCISPFSGGAHTFSDNDYSEVVLDHLLAAAIETARRQRKSDVVFMYIKQTESDLIRGLSRHGYTGVYLNSTGIVHNRFNAFEDYLKSLSQSGRKSAKRDMSKFRKSPYTITDSRDEPSDAGMIFELIEQFERKYPSRGNLYSLEKIKAFLEKMAPYSTTYSVSNSGEHIAVVTLFEKDSIINTYAFGIDFERAHKNRAYFNLLYYNTVKEMICRNAPYINFNAMAYKVKSSRGCELVQQYMYVMVLKGRLWMEPWLSIIDKQYRNKFEKFFSNAQAAYRSTEKK